MGLFDDAPKALGYIVAPVSQAPNLSMKAFGPFSDLGSTPSTSTQGPWTSTIGSPPNEERARSRTPRGGAMVSTGLSEGAGDKRKATFRGLGDRGIWLVPLQSSKAGDQTLPDLNGAN